MSYLLHFSGPSSFEQTVTVKPGGEPVVVGRDPEAAVYLPDTERLISRRHLSIAWSEQGARVSVLSANGINTDQGDYFSGDEVVLRDGESARVGSFSLIVTAVQSSADLDATSFSGMGTRPIPTGPDTRAAPVDKPGEPDPWAQLAAQWSPGGDRTTPGGAPVVPPRPGLTFDLDDPFAASASWRVTPDATVPDPFTVSGSLQPGRPVVGAADRTAPSATMPMGMGASAATGGTGAGAATPEKLALQSLCRGLGVDMPTVLNSFDWERLGASVREVVECLGDHLASRAASKQTLKVEDRTLLNPKEVNPLRTAMPVKEMLQYLLFMPEGVGGFVPPQRALQEVAHDARAHEAASRAAARSLAEGALKEFEPARLRGVLLKGKLSLSSVVDNARLWDLYTTHYEQQDAGEWTAQLFNRHYMAGYLREVERLRRAAQPKPPERTA